MGVAFYAENDMRWASGTVGVSFGNYSFNGDFISMIFKKKMPQHLLCNLVSGRDMNTVWEFNRKKILPFNFHAALV